MVRIEREKSGNLVSTYVSDKLTQEDYDKILPALQQTLNEWNGVRWYFEMRDFSGWEPAAALQDLKFDVEHANEIAKVAMVGTKKWQEWLTKAMKPFTSAEVRFFDLLEREEALRWVKS